MLVGTSMQAPSDDLPRHIAIIMDGNGRWAKRRGLPRIEGHRKGADSVREVTRVATLIGLFFASAPVVDYDGARRADHERYARCFHGLLERGVFFAPSGYETLFVSLAHDEKAAETTAAGGALLTGDAHPLSQLGVSSKGPGGIVGKASEPVRSWNGIPPGSCSRTRATAPPR